MKSFLAKLLHGMALPLEVTYSPLYRYPYRQSGEAMRGDWLRLGKDVESVLKRGGGDE